MRQRLYKSVQETLFEEVLPNGLTVRVLPKTNFNRTFAAFATDYGGADRRFSLGGNWIDTPAGIAHYLEHKMFDLPEGNAMNMLAANGAQPNAFTSSDMTAYYFESTKRFEENLKMLLHFVSPVRCSVAGTVESIAEITPQMLYDCHKAFYAPSNMALSVVGNVNPQLVVDMAEKLLPADKLPKPVVDYGPEEPLTPVTRYTETHMAVSAPQFMIGAKVQPELYGLAHMHQKHVGALALQALFGRSSRFYADLYSKNILSPDFDIDFDYSANTATIFFAGESSQPQAVYDAILAAADEVRRNGLDKVKFDRVKNASLGSLIFGLEDFDGMAVSLAQSAFYKFNQMDTFTWQADVFPEECARFIAENLTEERLAMSVVKPTVE